MEQTQDKYLTVSQFTDQLKANIENQFSTLLIKGEISNFRPSTSGIWYLVLKDEGASIRAIVFRNNQAKILNQLKKYQITQVENGQNVLVEGKINVYKKGGDYSIIIEKIIPVGLGELYLKFENLKKQLEQEGLFDSVNKKELPRYPLHIGIVTSPTGAALQDILNVLKRRFSALKITVYPALVQGEMAKYDLVKAIRYADHYYRLNASASPEVLIIARGGGSLEDLWSFNEQEVAYAIHKASIPIITGIGHEVDFTIADFCADQRAPTPSAAAELVVKSAEDLLISILSYQSRIENGLFNLLEKLKMRFKACDLSILNKLLERKYQEKIQILTFNQDKLIATIKSNISEKRQKFLLLTQKLSHFNPLETLNRGYSLVYTENNQVVKSISQVNKDDPLKIRLSDGHLKATINEIQPS